MRGILQGSPGYLSLTPPAPPFSKGGTRDSTVSSAFERRAKGKSHSPPPSTAGIAQQADFGGGDTYSPNSRLRPPLAWEEYRADKDALVARLPITFHAIPRC